MYFRTVSIRQLYTAREFLLGVSRFLFSGPYCLAAECVWVTMYSENMYIFPFYWVVAGNSLPSVQCWQQRTVEKKMFLCLANTTCNVLACKDVFTELFRIHGFGFQEKIFFIYCNPTDIDVNSIIHITELRFIYGNILLLITFK